MIESPKGTRHIQARLSDDEFETVRARAGSSRGAMQKFARAAILEAVATELSDIPYPYEDQNRSLHDKLETILNSGDEDTMLAVIPNIELFFKRLKPNRQGTRTAPDRQPGYDPIRARILAAYDSGSLPMRQKLLAVAGKDLDLGPERMPAPKRPGDRKHG